MQTGQQPNIRPAVALTDTPEFKAAVAQATTQALASAIPQLLAELTQARVALGAPASESGDKHWAEKLTLALAQLNDPGRQLIAPEVAEARAKAKVRLKELLIESYAKVKAAIEAGDEKRALALAPQYRLVAKTQLPIGDSGPQLVEPLQRNPHNNRVYPTRIRWLDVPNLAMQPANDPAKEIFDAFLETIGNKVPDIKYPEDMPIGAPPPGGFMETEYSLTNNGNAVAGLSMAQIASRAHLNVRPMDRFGLVLDEDGAAVVPNAGGPPYVDVQVLGTIAPPARQNG